MYHDRLLTFSYLMYSRSVICNEIVITHVSLQSFHCSTMAFSDDTVQFYEVRPADVVGPKKEINALTRGMKKILT